MSKKEKSCGLATRAASRRSTFAVSVHCLPLRVLQVEHHRSLSDHWNDSEQRFLP